MPDPRGLHSAFGGLKSRFDGLVKEFQAQAAPPPQNQAHFGGGQQYASTFLSRGNDTSAPALRAVQYSGPPPAGSMLFTLNHADPNASPVVGFFFTCLPDPVGLAYHALEFARARLSFPGRPIPWRIQHLTIKLADEPGLAWASGGTITISTQWANDLMKQHREGKRDEASCTFELKGVILHELVHCIQHNGFGTAPGWLIESIADSVRLAGRLGPPHWRKPGQGRRDKGWEDAYDAGALFLAWLMGETPVRGASGQMWAPTPIPTSDASSTSSAPQATSTQYPMPGPPPIPPKPGHEPTYSPGPLGQSGRPRRGPFPDFVRQLDAFLTGNKWDDGIWQRMTGASLPQLWNEYLDYYA